MQGFVPLDMVVKNVPKRDSKGKVVGFGQGSATVHVKEERIFQVTSAIIDNHKQFSVSIETASGNTEIPVTEACYDRLFPIKVV